MPMYHFFSPMGFRTEFVYTLIVVFLCFLVYYKTREIYNLTKHKGIGYFRITFLFFGLAYASRFILHLLTFTSRLIFDFFIPRGMMFPIIMIPTGYLSTMAIFYLAYSTIWKKIKYNHFIVFSNITAVFVSAIAFISRSPIIVSTVQLLFLVFTIIISTKKHKKGKKRSHIRALYSLISIFWLINLFVLGPTRFLPLEVKYILQLISITVFIAIFYKVTKWTK